MSAFGRSRNSDRRVKRPGWQKGEARSAGKDDPPMSNDPSYEEAILETVSVINHLHEAQFAPPDVGLVQLTHAQEDIERIAEMIDHLLTRTSNRVADLR